MAPSLDSRPMTSARTAFRQALSERIVVFDGAGGTMLQSLHLDEAGFRGERLADHPEPLSGLHDALCLTRPELVERVHRDYLAAGAEALTTNTFNANAVSLADYGASHLAFEMNREGARAARRAVEAFAPDRRVFVLGSIGPTNRTLGISPRVEDPGYRAVSWEALRSAYLEQARGLLAGGADLLLVETCFDTLNAKAALDACREALDEVDAGSGLIVSFTAVDRGGRNLTGQDSEAFWISVAHAGVTAAGVNCSFGAETMRPFVERLAACAPVPVGAVPNAGLPNDLGEYDETPATTAEALAELADSGLLNFTGGCCGTTPDHIAAVRAAVRGAAPRRLPEPRAGLRLAGTDPLVRPERAFLVVGERTNVTGSRRFARLIRRRKFEAAARVARGQVRGGANLLDVNMDAALLDSASRMRRFLRFLAMEPDIARLPILVDSSKLEVIETGLRCLPGKGVVNSLSLKDGESAFLEAARRVRRYGAAIVVMAFDEVGQAVDADRKTAICLRAYRLLTGIDVPPEDIVFDPNVLAVATGMAEHDRYAVEFLEALPRIAAACPGALLSGGISNLSFAFRGHETVRGAMNAVFLHHAIAAGLDMAIVNAGRLPVVDDIPAELRERVEDVIFARRPDATARLVALASRTGRRAGARRAKETWRGLPVGERLAHAVIHGILDHVGEDAIEAIGAEGSALSVIEGPLMDGMRVVGDRFGDGRMFLPQVVKSARVMKRAVARLRPHMETGERAAARRPRIVLATVRGDVHDIGKSIVGIVLACSGYEVEDLGVMVPADGILAAAEAGDAALVGLSGLITPSLDEMERFAVEMERRGDSRPLLIGGATTSARHTALRIAPRRSGPVVHVRDASRATGVARSLLGADRESYLAAVRERQARERGRRAGRGRRRLLPLEEARRRAPRFSRAKDVRASFLGVRLLPDVPLRELLPFVDWTPFFHAWQFRGTWPGLLDHPEAGPPARELLEAARARAESLAETRAIRAAGAYGFFPAAREGDDLLLWEDGDARGSPRFRIPTLRQQEDRPGPRLAAADFVAPANADGPEDVVGLFCVTAGLGLRAAVAAAERREDDYEALLLRSLADRLAEAFAERLHQRARRDLGYGAAEDLSPRELLRGRYRGIRPAPGYPATPDLSILQPVFEALGAEAALGVRLTESFAIEPAASVAGLYFGSAEARYFSVGRIGRDQLEDYAGRRQIPMERAEALLRRVL